MPNWHTTYDRLAAAVGARGVHVRESALGTHTPCTFDGLSITTSTDCDRQTNCHGLAHAFGHVIQWSTDRAGHQALYDELYTAKAAGDAARLDAALARFRQYEEEASEYAVGLLTECGCADAVPAFTTFARADIEAIVDFHRTGTLPDWPQFFAEWCRGEDPGPTLVCRPVPTFQPLPMEAQEVIQ
jgi:hypothetical protein